MSVVCNLDCICVDGDCKFFHPITIKERKIVKRLYDNITNPNKSEANSESRKANCRFGKLCHNSCCGYRHRLNYTDRKKLIDGFNQSKIDATKTEKVPTVAVAKLFTIENKNAFTELNIEEEVAETPIATNQTQCWADMADDDDFYMDFK